MKPLSERIEIEKAFLDGEQLEIFMFSPLDNKHRWVRYDKKLDKDSFVFNWDKLSYRIKPEPRVIYVRENHDGEVVGKMVYLSRESADKLSCGKRIIRFIEDLEGD